MSLIEKIARALCTADKADPDKPLAVFKGEPAQAAWTLYTDDAQAALTAITEYAGDGVQEVDRVEAEAMYELLGLAGYQEQLLAQAFARHRSTAAAAERARMEWQPIETAPKDGAYILGFGPHEIRKSYTDAIHWWGGRWTITWMEGYGEPTHWMPLPAPPADAIERGEV